MWRGLVHPWFLRNILVKKVHLYLSTFSSCFEPLTSNIHYIIAVSPNITWNLRSHLSMTTTTSTLPIPLMEPLVSFSSTYTSWQPFPSMNKDLVLWSHFANWTMQHCRQEKVQGTCLSKKPVPRYSVCDILTSTQCKPHTLKKTCMFTPQKTCGSVDELVWRQDILPYNKDVKLTCWACA